MLYAYLSLENHCAYVVEWKTPQRPMHRWDPPVPWLTSKAYKCQIVLQKMVKYRAGNGPWRARDRIYQISYMTMEMRGRNHYK